MQEKEIQKLLNPNSYPIDMGIKDTSWGVITKDGIIVAYKDYVRAKKTAQEFAKEKLETVWLVQFTKKYEPVVLLKEKNYQYKDKNKEKYKIRKENKKVLSFFE